MSTATKCALLSLAATAAIFVAGCSSAVPKAAPEPVSVKTRIDGFKINDDDYRKLGYRRDWMGFPNVAGGGHIDRLRNYGDIVVVVESGGSVTAMDAGNGGVKWSNAIVSPLTRIVGLERQKDSVRGDCILVISDAEIFFLSAATGNQVTRQPLEKVVNTSPILLADAAIFGSPTGEIVAHSFESGMKAWGLETESVISAAPVQVGNQVAVVSDTGSVYFLDSSSGAISSRTRLFGGTETDPVVSGPIVVVASTDQSLYGVSVGGMEWRVRTSSPLIQQPASYKNRIYIATKDWGFACFEASSGKKLWGAADVTGTPIGIRNGYLLVWNKGTITRIDAQHGDVIDRTTLATVRSVWTDSFEDGTLFAASDTGLVLRLNPAK